MEFERGGPCRAGVVVHYAGCRSAEEAAKRMRASGATEGFNLMPRFLAVAPWAIAGAFVLLLTPARAAEDPVVATVDGASIHLSEVERIHSQLPEQYRAYPLQMLFPDLLDMVVDRRLAADTARKQGLGNDPEVKATLARVEEDVLQRALLTRHIEKTLTDDALKAHYDKMVAGMPASELVHARHILVDSEAEAKRAIEDLKKGADFAKLAEERSTGPSKAKGGDLGFFGKDEMVPEFADAAFNLKPGETTQQPVQTQFGWHVIKVEERKAAEAPSFEDSREELKAEMSRDIGISFVKDLRDKAKVERFNMDGTPMQPATPETPAK